ncbi:hypothetical protein KQX54_005087 [Cotesia glomerata]|uniref:Uncharacterized protein n=1 Tax=Cotesia glomerata TaxID=32391 RepID=A0AAV7ICS2_COTGL|nr:hypothetical protein KQX54_005087 [Cotesia glomerata]
MKNRAKDRVNNAWNKETECQVDIVDGDNAAEIVGEQRGRMMTLLANERAGELSELPVDSPPSPSSPPPSAFFLYLSRFLVRTPSGYPSQLACLWLSNSLMTTPRDQKQSATTCPVFPLSAKMMTTEQREKWLQYLYLNVSIPTLYLRQRGCDTVLVNLGKPYLRTYADNRYKASSDYKGNQLWGGSLSIPKLAIVTSAKNGHSTSYLDNIKVAGSPLITGWVYCRIHQSPAFRTLQYYQYPPSTTTDSKHRSYRVYKESLSIETQRTCSSSSYCYSYSCLHQPESSEALYSSPLIYSPPLSS